MDQLTSSQLAEWEAYNELDPVGKWRDDFNFASLSSLIINTVLSLFQDLDDKKRGKKPEYTTAMEFMPEFDPQEQDDEEVEKKAFEPPKQKPEDIKWLFQQMAIISRRNKPISEGKYKKKRVRDRTKPKPKPKQ